MHLITYRHGYLMLTISIVFSALWALNIPGAPTNVEYLVLLCWVLTPFMFFADHMLISRPHLIH